MGSLHSRNVGSGELFPRIEEWKESEVPSGGSMQKAGRWGWVTKEKVPFTELRFSLYSSRQHLRPHT